MNANLCLSDPDVYDDNSDVDTCDECGLGCCDKYRACASDKSECKYYDGDVAPYIIGGETENYCVDSECVTGCCINGFCAL